MTTKKRTRLAQSFSEEEVALLAQIFENLLRGGDVRLLVRNRRFGRLHHKIKSMKAKIDQVVPEDQGSQKE